MRSSGRPARPNIWRLIILMWLTRPSTYTLTGPAPITHAEIAAALTSALGRDITFIDVPPDVFAKSLQAILPPWQIQGLLEDYAHYRRGEAASVSPAVAEITGRPAIDVKQFAHDYAPAFAVQVQQRADSS